MLLKEVRIKAYKSFDDRFTTLMTKEDIMESVAGKTDTVNIVDPVTGNEETRYIKP